MLAKWLARAGMVPLVLLPFFCQLALWVVDLGVSKVTLLVPVVLAVGLVRIVTRHNWGVQERWVKVLLVGRETLGRFNILPVVVVVLAPLERAQRQTPQPVERVGLVSLPQLLVRLLVVPVVVEALRPQAQWERQRMAAALVLFLMRWLGRAQ